MTTGFAVLTTVANELIQLSGQKRSTVVLRPGDVGKFVSRNRAISSITAMLKPFYAKAFNIHQISPLIFFPNAKDKDLLKPVAPQLNKRYKTTFKQ